MNLIIGSLEPHVGKTTLCLTIALAAKEGGKKVGYFKPIGRYELDADGSKKPDNDAIRAKNLLQMDESVDIICPLQLNGERLEKSKTTKLKEKIIGAFNTLSEEYDFLVIDSHEEIYEWSYVGLSLLNLAQELNGKVIILISTADEKSVFDQTFLAKNLMITYNVPCLGYIYARISQEIFDEEVDRISEFADSEEINILGFIPNKPELMAPTVRQLIPIIKAKVLSGSEYLDNIVTSYLVGAMEADEAIRYFRRSTKKAVITGGDRSSIALSSLETDTSVLIFTGNIHPTDKILSKADNNKVPCLIVKTDTFSTVKKLTEKKILGEFYSINDPKISLWKKLIKEIASPELLHYIQ